MLVMVQGEKRGRRDGTVAWFADPHAGIKALTAAAKVGRNRAIDDPHEKKSEETDGDGSRSRPGRSDGVDEDDGNAVRDNNKNKKRRANEDGGDRLEEERQKKQRGPRGKERNKTQEMGAPLRKRRKQVF